jgi:mRNA interferase MazF
LQRGVINAGFVGKIGLQGNVLQNLIPAERETILDTIKRGDIYYADLSPVVGSEQGGVRPVLIVQNNVGNRYSPTVIAAAITSQVNKAKMPTHIELGARSFGLTRDSIVLMEQIRTLDKKRLREKMGTLDETAMRSVDEALAVSFGLGAQD